jgi:hypothetical protein
MLNVQSPDLHIGFRSFHIALDVTKCVMLCSLLKAMILGAINTLATQARCVGE